MIDLGKVRPGSTIRVPFGSFAATTGAPSAVTNYADADIQVYKDGGTTQRASAAGMTATTTFDTLTGINMVTIDLADNTTAGFWAAGSEYIVVISDITVDAQTLRFPIARFTIGVPGELFATTVATLASQTSFTLTAGPAEDDALNGCILYFHDVASAVQCGFAVVSDYTGSTKTVTLVAGTTFTVAATDNVAIMTPRLMPTVAGRTLDVSAGGEAGVDWANVGTPGSTVALSATTVGTITTYTGNTPQTGDSFARIGAAGAGLTAVPWNSSWDAEVQSEVNDGLVAYNAASTTNITAAAGITVSAIGAGVITAASIAASALDGKGNWNIGKTGYTLTAGTGLGNQTADITGNLSGSVGSVTGAVGSVTGAVGSVTGAVGSVTGNVGGNVTGSVGSVVGAVGSVVGAVGSVTGLTASDVAAIKAKSDQMVFGATGAVNANLTHINEVELQGDGTTGSRWNPV
jgi:hypothetical protein